LDSPHYDLKNVKGSSSKFSSKRSILGSVWHSIITLDSQQLIILEITHFKSVFYKPDHGMHYSDI